MVEDVVILGHRVSHGVTYPHDDKVSALANFKIPTSKKELQELYGLLSYLRDYVPNFAQIT